MTKINLSKIKINRYYIIIVLLTFIVFGNGINNEYAIDDNMVTEGVKKVEKGILGIKEIFTTTYATGKQNYGYRPLVQTTFAIEKQLFKKLPVKQTLKEKERKDVLTQANISHFINVLIYAILCMVLFSFLKNLFNEHNLIFPFTITLLFLVHPLHTEPVDNLKSRDELLMLLTMLLSLKFYLKYSVSSQTKHLLLGALFVLLAMLSKKNAIAMIGLVPVVLYFSKTSAKKIAISMATIIAIFTCFILIKKGLVSVTSSRNIKYFENPLRFEGSFMDRITVGLYSSWFYLKMLIFPKDLSFYYGYNQIPMANWSYWQVWISILFYIPLGIYGFMLFIKRKVLGFGIVIWLGLMLGVINVFFPIVGVVADRFTFTFSLGYCIVVAYLLMKFFKVDLTKDIYKANLSSGFLTVFGCILLIYSVRTIARNPDWHDKMTLYENDIEHLKESAKAHALLSNTYYPILSNQVRNNPGNPEHKANIDKLIFHYQEAIRIDSTYLTSLNNLGSAYMNFRKDYEKTIKFCEKAVKIDDNYIEAHYNLGHAYGAKGEIDKSLHHYARIIEIDVNYMQVYEVFNNMVVKNNKLKEGIELLIKCSKKVDNPKNVYLDIANLYSLDNYDVKHSIIYFEKAYEIDKSDLKLCNHIATLCNSIGDFEKANHYISLCNS